MEITYTTTTTSFATCAAPSRRLAMPSAAAFGRVAVWSALKPNQKHVAVAGNVPGVPVWSPPHC